MSEKKNYYQVLKVSPLASLPTIKKSYRKLVQIHHPDKNPNDPKAEETFKAINEAYEVLSDTFKRKDFDRQIKKEKEATEKKRATPIYRYDSFHTPFDERPSEGLGSASSAPPGDISKNFTGRKSVSDQICGTVEISLEEATLGCEKKISGKILRNRTLQTTNFTVHIPPGVEETQKIKLKSHKKLKNLYVSIAYKKHPLFKKDEKNILMNLPIPFTKAILGGRVEIPTLRGKISFNLPPGVHAGHIIQLKNQGFPSLTEHRKRGNMLISLLIDVPSNLSEEEKTEIKKLKNKDLLCPKVAEFDIKAKLLLKKRQK